MPDQTPDPMTTDRNSEGAVATVIRKGAGLGGLAWTQAGRVADLPDAAPLYTTPPASIPAAEVQALVDAARRYTEIPFSAEAVTVLHNELLAEIDRVQKLIPRNPE